MISATATTVYALGKPTDELLNPPIYESVCRDLHQRPLPEVTNYFDLADRQAYVYVGYQWQLIDLVVSS